MKRLLIALALAIALPALADGGIEVQKKWGIKYASGGMTEDEKVALQEISPRFPIHLYFYIEGSNEPISGVRVVAKDVRGDVVLEAEAHGPMFLMDAGSGRYTIEAEFKGEKLSETKDLVGRRYLVLQYAFRPAN